MRVRNGIILGILGWLSVSHLLSAQDHSLDHVKGSHGIQIGGGIGDRTGLFKVGYYYWFAKKFSVKGDFYYLHTRDGEVKGFSLSRYGFDVAPVYQVFTHRGLLSFSVFLGLTTAWNSIKVESGEFGYEDQMKFGFFGGGEMEVRIYKKLMGWLSGDTRYMLGNDFGHWRIYGTVGLRYSF